MTLPRADGERVRFCMHCNEVVPFQVRVCPACGQFEPQVDDERGPRRDCQACQRPVPAQLVLCPHCGRETGRVPLPRERRVAPRDVGAGDGDPRAGRYAFALTLAGPALLLLAVAATLL